MGNSPFSFPGRMLLFQVHVISCYYYDCSGFCHHGWITHYAQARELRTHGILIIMLSIRIFILILQPVQNGNSLS